MRNVGRYVDVFSLPVTRSLLYLSQISCGFKVLVNFGSNQEIFKITIVNRSSIPNHVPEIVFIIYSDFCVKVVKKEVKRNSRENVERAKRTIKPKSSSQSWQKKKQSEQVYFNQAKRILTKRESNPSKPFEQTRAGGAGKASIQGKLSEQEID